MYGIKDILKYISNHPLAKRNHVKAYWRFFSWQFSQRLFPRTIAYQLTEHSKIWVKKGMTGATGSIYTGLHEFEDMAFLMHFLRKESLFADIGANVGIFSVLATAECGAKTLSFEPAPNTYQWVEKNRTLNGVEALQKCFNIGVGAKEETVQFSTDLDTINHVVQESETGVKSVTVQIRPFDSIAAEEGVPELVKIDVEGFEMPVIQGMQQTLSNPKLQAIIIELNGSGTHYGFDEKSIHENLQSHGFSPYQYEPFTRSLKAVTHWGTHNTIYIKDIALVSKRVKEAKKITVFGVPF